MSIPQEKIELEAINIIKGLCFAQLTVQIVSPQTEQMREKLVSSPDFDPEDIFNRIDRKRQKRLFPEDLCEFLSVHRIAASERECQFLISLNGNPQTYMTFEYFLKYIYGGSQQLPRHSPSPMPSRTAGGDQLIKNYTQRQTAKVFEKEIEFYRSLETLKQDYVSHYGYSFQGLYKAIAGTNTIDEMNLAAFINKFRNRGVEFSHEEYEALCRRIAEKGTGRILYQEFARAFAPFQPINFPIFRKENNLREALEIIRRQVHDLNIDTNNLQLSPQLLSQTNPQKTGFGRTNVSFRRVFDPLRQTNPQGGSARYFYDKDYFNQLKQYKVNYFDPNKDYKFNYQEDPTGPQYHDHFFEGYYQYLHERNKSEYFYNKFGKRYTFENAMDGKRVV